MPRENPWRATRFLLLAGVSALVVRPAAAQDLDAQVKWTEAKVVHYKIVGDYTGTMTILHGTNSLRNAPVSDHLEFEFDWDNQEMALLGTPVLRNVATKVGTIEMPAGMECPPVRLEAPPEFATVTKVTAVSVLLQIELKSQLGRGAIPWTGNTSSGKCGDAWDPAAPSEETTTLNLQLPPGMMLAMAPEMTGYDRSKDGKSMLTKPENGWSWVITPNIVR